MQRLFSFIKRELYAIALLAGIVCFVASCRPKGVLSSGQMEDLFVDLHRAEGIIYVKGYKNGHDSVVRLTYDSILAAHGVTRAQFDSSLVWYTDNPMLFNKIYPHVMERLEAIQEEERRNNEEAIQQEKTKLQQIEDERRRTEEQSAKLPPPTPDRIFLKSR